MRRIFVILHILALYHIKELAAFSYVSSPLNIKPPHPYWLAQKSQYPIVNKQQISYKNNANVRGSNANQNYKRWGPKFVIIESKEGKKRPQLDKSTQIIQYNSGIPDEVPSYSYAFKKPINNLLSRYPDGQFINRVHSGRFENPHLGEMQTKKENSERTHYIEDKVENLQGNYQNSYKNNEFAATNLNQNIRYMKPTVKIKVPETQQLLKAYKKAQDAILKMGMLPNKISMFYNKNNATNSDGAIDYLTTSNGKYLPDHIQVEKMFFAEPTTVFTDTDRMDEPQYTATRSSKQPYRRNITNAVPAESHRMDEPVYKNTPTSAYRVTEDSYYERKKNEKLNIKPVVRNESKHGIQQDSPENRSYKTVEKLLNKNDTKEQRRKDGRTINYDPDREILTFSKVVNSAELRRHEGELSGSGFSKTVEDDTPPLIKGEEIPSKLAELLPKFEKPLVKQTSLESRAKSKSSAEEPEPKGKIKNGRNDSHHVAVSQTGDFSAESLQKSFAEEPMCLECNLMSEKAKELGSICCGSLQGKSATRIDQKTILSQAKLLSPAVLHSPIGSAIEKVPQVVHNGTKTRQVLPSEEVDIFNEETPTEKVCPLCHSKVLESVKSKMFWLYRNLLKQESNHVVEIFSTGCHKDDCLGALGSIKLDGVELGGGVDGMNVVVLDYPDYNFLFSKTYNTGREVAESDKLVKFMEELSGPCIVLVVAQGDATSALTVEAWEKMKMLAGNDYLFIPPKGSFAFIGFKGQNVLPWRQWNQKRSGHGASAIFTIFGAGDEYITFGGSGSTVGKMVDNIIQSEVETILPEENQSLKPTYAVASEPTMIFKPTEKRKDTLITVEKYKHILKRLKQNDAKRGEDDGSTIINRSSKSNSSQGANSTGERNKTMEMEADIEVSSGSPETTTSKPMKNDLSFSRTTNRLKSKEYFTEDRAEKSDGDKTDDDNIKQFDAPRNRSYHNNSLHYKTAQQLLDHAENILDSISGRVGSSDHTVLNTIDATVENSTDRSFEEGLILPDAELTGLGPNNSTIIDDWASETKPSKSDFETSPNDAIRFYVKNKDYESKPSEQVASVKTLPKDMRLGKPTLRAAESYVPLQSTKLHEERMLDNIESKIKTLELSSKPAFNEESFPTSHPLYIKKNHERVGLQMPVEVQLVESEKKTEHHESPLQKSSLFTAEVQRRMKELVSLELNRTLDNFLLVPIKKKESGEIEIPVGLQNLKKTLHTDSKKKKQKIGGNKQAKGKLNNGADIAFHGRNDTVGTLDQSEVITMNDQSNDRMLNIASEKKQSPENMKKAVSHRVKNHKLDADVPYHGLSGDLSDITEMKSRPDVDDEALRALEMMNEKTSDSKDNSGEKTTLGKPNVKQKIKEGSKAKVKETTDMSDGFSIVSPTDSNLVNKGVKVLAAMANGALKEHNVAVSSSASHRTDNNATTFNEADISGVVSLVEPDINEINRAMESKEEPAVEDVTLVKGGVGKEVGSACKRYKMTKVGKGAKVKRECIEQVFLPKRKQAKGPADVLPESSAAMVSLALSPGYSTVNRADSRQPEDISSYYFNNNGGAPGIYSDGNNIFEQGGDYIDAAERVLASDVKDAYSAAKQMYGESDGAKKRKKENIVKSKNMRFPRKKKRPSTQQKKISQKAFVDKMLADSAFKWK